MIEEQSIKFRVPLGKPQDIDEFLNCVSRLREERKKSEQVLLEEIENDIEGKEKFISEQVLTLEEIISNF